MANNLKYEVISKLIAPTAWRSYNRDPDREAHRDVGGSPRRADSLASAGLATRSKLCRLLKLAHIIEFISSAKKIKEYLWIIEAMPARRQFEKFSASDLYCPKCRRLSPVRERLLLVMPAAELYDYRCQVCGESLGSREVKSGAQRVRPVTI